MARTPDFDLAGALASPSFTPAQRDAAALAELVVAGSEPAAQRAAAALAKLGETGRKAVDTRLAGRGPVAGDAERVADTAELGDAATSRLVGVLGLLARAGDTTALESLVTRTRDEHVRVRRAAISALGKVRGDVARDALIARFDAGNLPPDEQRTLVEALGKVGGDEALARVGSVVAGEDSELERRQHRAQLMIVRTRARDTASAIAVDAKPAVPLDVILRCKQGLAPMLVEELGTHGIRAKVDGDEGAVVKLAGPWASLYASRLWHSGAFRIPFGRGDELVERITTALQAPAVRDTLTAMTRGEVRYRLGFTQGKRRSLIWQLARTLPFLNDPTDSTWQFTVDDERETIEIEPRKAVDPRFAWRVAEVPAASHPTVAAALAYVAGTLPTDRVWDPFVGSGAELVERARLGVHASLVGSDLDDTALAAARQNIDAAGITARLERGDARSFDPGGASLIITNPPLGSRVQLDAVGLLIEALPHFASVLAPNGRLVWITPATKRTSPVAEKLGLHRAVGVSIDLGGVRGTLERWER